MTSATTALILASTATHAYWNFLLKRVGGTDPDSVPTVTGLSKVAEAVLFAPVFLWWLAPLSTEPFARVHAVAAAWPLIIVGAALTLSNYVALSRAYALADLSLVYPISRGAVLLVLPILGWLVFGERISAIGGLALGMILFGIVALQMPDRSSVVRPAANQAVIFALLAALAAASYTVWDKRAIGFLAPFAYFYSYTCIVALAYAVMLVRRVGRARLREAWRHHRLTIVQVGLGNTITYLLVLIALRNETSSYVIGLRQLSIAIGVLLGWLVLGETIGRARQLGVMLILVGCLLVSFAK
jgi:drug/metabolite transporter (DMT)-like permease